MRQERPDDAAVVWAVHRAAFERRTEADLAAALRRGGHAVAALSLVVELGGRVVGHVVCSRGALGRRPAIGLGPIGVVPPAQGVGAGSALMHAVLGAADALAEPFVVLLGSPEYYHRFGFVTATDVGIDPPDPSWGRHFQARLLTAHTPDMIGQFAYAPPFDAA